MRLRTIVTATLITAVTASVAIACSVPVFRYALEHWRPDSYAIYVFHSGELSADHHSLIDSMQPKNSAGNLLANVVVRAVDVNAEIDDETKRIWQAQKSETLPWMVVQSPPKHGPPNTVWQGAFTTENAAMVINSPARQEISRKLLEGESVVWVFLECGRKEEDDSAFELLTAELEKLETEITLPEIDEEDLGNLSIAPDALKVVFSAIRISRNDTAEPALAEMLLRVEPDLLDEPQVSQPMAFPVFGRGRALYALVGKGIAPDVIKEACVFLTGGCQCTVKAQNPGVDLIMSVDWDKHVVPTETKDDALPPLAGFAGFAEPNAAPASSDTGAVTAHAEAVPISQPTTVSVLPGSTSSDSTNAAPSTTTIRHSQVTVFGKNVLYVLTSLVIIVAIATFYFMPRAN